MKKTTHIFLCCFAFMALVSCEKDDITNAYIDQNRDRTDVKVQQLREVLASAENGWVMMLKTSMSDSIYTPLVMKFDTLTGKVQYKTVYGLQKGDAYFRISEGTGNPRLEFTTGSVMTTLFRIGPQASDITDHVFNLVDLSQDTISIASYRSGTSFTKEGGVVHHLFRRPQDWTWADDSLVANWADPLFMRNVNNIIGKMKLEYLNSSLNKEYDWGFERLSNPFENQNIYPFENRADISSAGFQRTYFMLTVGPSDIAATAMGYNAISFMPFDSMYPDTGPNLQVLISAIKTPYLVFKNQNRNGRNVKMEFEAYGKNGEVMLRAFYDNKF